MVVKVHCGTVLGDIFQHGANSSSKTVPQYTMTTISARYPAQPQSCELQTSSIGVSSLEFKRVLAQKSLIKK